MKLLDQRLDLIDPPLIVLSPQNGRRRTPAFTDVTQALTTPRYS